MVLRGRFVRIVVLLPMTKSLQHVSRRDSLSSAVPGRECFVDSRIEYTGTKFTTLSLSLFESSWSLSSELQPIRSDPIQSARNVF